MKLSLSISSAMWAASTQGGIVAIRLLSTIILSRLLFPEAFGVILIITTLTILINLLSDIGLRGSIINNEKSDYDTNYVNTIWTLKILRGFVIATGLTVFSVFAADIYPHIDDISIYVLLAAATAAIKGFESTKLQQMERSLAMMRPAILQIGTRLVALIATVCFAMLNPSVYSILFGEIVSVTFLAILSHTYLVGTKNRVHIDRSELDGIFKYGKWIFWSTCLTWVINEGHKFTLGITLSAQTLGFYALASNIALALRQIMSNFSDRWAFPAYKRLENSPNEDWNLFRIRGVMVISSMIALSLLVALSDVIVATLYEDQYDSVSPFLKVIAIGSLGTIVGEAYIPIFKARRDSRGLMSLRFVQSIVLICFIGAGYSFKSTEGIIFGTAIAELTLGPVTAVISGKHLKRKIYLIDSVVYVIPFFVLLFLYSDALSLVL